MQTITLTPFHHRNNECIGIYFTSNMQLNTLVKNLPGVKWSQTNKCWYVLLNKVSYDMLVKNVAGKAIVNNALLKQYLHNRNKIAAVATSTPGNSSTIKQPATSAALLRISNTNLDALTHFVQQLQLKAYSAATIRTYRNEFCQLLQTIKQKNVNTLTIDELKRYMVYAMKTEGISENTAHSRLNALKFYFEQVLGREKFFWEIPRPKKAVQLPNILGEKELTALFKALANKKHKAILFTAYSAGLRVSETVNLKHKDIDSGRMLIKVQNAKGKKDRFVNLSPILLNVLRDYIKTSQPRPKEYVFESDIAGEPYSSRSAQKIFQRAKEIAGIKKEVSFHSLRHSFATHLLEKGIDIRYIKDILGHFDIKTTERYTHVSKAKLVTITSPLDDLWLKGDMD
jgi:integrase/recombinase XerD